LSKEYGRSGAVLARIDELEALIHDGLRKCRSCYGAGRVHGVASEHLCSRQGQRKILTGSAGIRSVAPGRLEVGKFGWVDHSINRNTLVIAASRSCPCLTIGLLTTLVIERMRRVGQISPYFAPACRNRLGSTASLSMRVS
jgi:hypothetical protein